MIEEKAVDSTQDGEVSKYGEPIRWLLLGFLLALLATALFLILRPFIGLTAWACIVVLGAWPLHSRVMARFPNWPLLSASISSCLLILFVLGGLLPVLGGIGPEIKAASSQLTSYVEANQDQIVEKTSVLPVIGKSLSAKLASWQNAVPEMGPLLQEYSKPLLGTASLAAQGLAWFFFNSCFFCLAVFFLFYYGQSVASQFRLALLRVDDDTGKLIVLAENTVTGVLYGIVFTALAQGLLAGIGFAIAGARAPILLGLTTMVFAVIPYGPPLVYWPVALSFMMNGEPVKGVALALWGLLLVSSADNVLKPYFISRQAKLPLPLVLFGVTGGVLSFGVIGVFVGPVVMGLVRSLWLTWVDPQRVLVEAETTTEEKQVEEPETVEAPPEDIKNEED